MYKILQLLSTYGFCYDVQVDYKTTNTNFTCLCSLDIFTSQHKKLLPWLQNRLLVIK